MKVNVQAVNFNVDRKLVDFIQERMDKLEKYFDAYHLAIFPAFTPYANGKYSMHALIKIPRGGWVDPALLSKLKNLPPYFNINVDPESLL